MVALHGRRLARPVAAPRPDPTRPDRGSIPMSLPLAATHPPAVGRPAPDATLPDAAGTPVRLSDHWRAAPRGLALVFVRHFG